MMTQAKIAQTVKIVTVFASILLFGLFCIVGYQYVKMGTLSRRSSMLDVQIADLSVTQANLEEGIEVRSSDAYVEQQAREHLGMIKNNGEVIYVVD